MTLLHGDAFSEVVKCDINNKVVFDNIISYHCVKFDINYMIRKDIDDVFHNISLLYIFLKYSLSLSIVCNICTCTTFIAILKYFFCNNNKKKYQ